MAQRVLASVHENRGRAAVVRGRGGEGEKRRSRALRTFGNAVASALVTPRTSAQDENRPGQTGSSDWRVL
jgi:hypothetical protein